MRTLRRRRWLWVLVAVLAAALYTGYLLAFRAISHSDRAQKADSELRLFGHAVVGHYEGQKGELRDDPLTPTGDALSDKYAKLVYERCQQREWRESVSTAALPDSELAGWDGDFGSDPRYWELRCWCAEHTDTQPGVADPLDFLREARKRGVASANTTLVLYNAVRSTRVERERKSDTRPRAKGEMWIDRIYPPHGEEAAKELALLDAAVATGSDEAWPYYSRGAYWYSVGDPLKGLADLQRGNAAPKLIATAPFPCSAVNKHTTQTRMLGSDQVTGAVLLANMAADGTDYATSVARIGRWFLRHTPNASKEQQTAWLRYACRMPHDYESDRMGLTEAIFLIGGVQKNALDQSSLNPDYQQTLGRLYGACRKLIDAHPDYDLVNEMGALAARYGPQGQYIALAQEARSNTEATVKQAYPILDDIAQFNFADLDHPPKALLKYEPLTREEVKRRNAERRRREEAKKAMP